MATRFYLPSTGAAAVSPAFDGGWSDLGPSTRRAMVTTRISSAMATEARSCSFDAPGVRRCWLQYVGAPIGPQTITGTVKGQLRCSEANTDLDYDQVSVLIKVVSNDGTTVRGNLLALGEYVTANEFATSLTNRKIADGDSVTSVAAQANDRIVVEIGSRCGGPGETDEGDITGSFGDDSGTDLAEDESATAANNPWIEFSMDIAPPEQESTPSAVNSVGASSGAVGSPGAVTSTPSAVDSASGSGGASGTPGLRIISPAAVNSAGAIPRMVAEVVEDSYSPAALTSLGFGLIRAQTPPELGDADRLTMVNDSINGPATGTFVITASEMQNISHLPGAIVSVKFGCHAVFTEGRNAGGYPQDVTEMRMRWTTPQGTASSVIPTAIITDDYSDAQDELVLRTSAIPARPDGNPWTWADLDALTDVKVEADYNVPALEVLYFSVMEIFCEVSGYQGSVKTPIIIRSRAGAPIRKTITQVVSSLIVLSARSA